jgi:hypothetical protein
MAARELGGLGLADALDLTLLMRETDRWRYERAAVRWLERFIEERRPTLSEIALASAALAEVGGAGDASLRDLLRSADRNPFGARRRNKRRVRVTLGLETALEQPDQQHDDYDQRYESTSDVHAHTPFAVAVGWLVIEKR